ncbi:MarR family winged helix-turn-helix transcriptional regulator [Flammeovirga sp. EKP202]|uniref:MarR family winged helix-turn-helix transcriptional regulator n=1 Tax=Flammeovirga sp. EKP202 TaxID=2770592 RepID=UPI00165F9DEB|nr:MarR family transcriptional regulator [Flammeovirga sp. EKP202]MBD0401990.1 MarR family transcriptional regulator [Flammeovirga sp. EKP202]
MEQLKLSNQFCFPLYAASRFITQQYRPLLEKLEVTYPQYLVLLVLWEEDGIPIKEITEKLLLETNTLTPLLKRMQTNGLIERTRSKEDERIVTISLTEKGKKLQQKAEEIPNDLLQTLECLNIGKEDMLKVKEVLEKMLSNV